MLAAERMLLSDRWRVAKIMRAGKVASALTARLDIPQG